MAYYYLLLILSSLCQVHAFYSKEELCSLKKSEGKCPLEAKVERWFYKSGVCKMFLYSGCGGNANSFATKEECYGTCGNICLQPAEKGNEKQNHTRYYFNEIIGDCETFVYSGSGGNENNFADYMSCRKVCKNECTLKSDTGNCKASFPRFYYNAETSTCEQFIYGGCGGNNNNFRTIKECQKRCEESQHQ